MAPAKLTFKLSANFKQSRRQNANVVICCYSSPKRWTGNVFKQPFESVKKAGKLSVRNLWKVLKKQLLSFKKS